MPGTRVTDTGDGTMAVLAPTERVHHLDPSARLILKLCDGRTSLRQIAKVMAALRFDCDERQVAVTIDRLEDERLLSTGRLFRRVEGRAIAGLDIVVVANRHRPERVTASLAGLRHWVSYTRDWALPRWIPHPIVQRLPPLNWTGVLRCYLGHRQAFRLGKAPALLVLEDDAVPNRGDWLDVVRVATDTLDDFEAVCLHGREADPIRTTERRGGVTFHVLGSSDGEPLVVKALGASMAYVIRRTVAERIGRRPFDGYPMDLLLVNGLDMPVIAESPFDHDRSQGSLTETAR